MGDIADGNFIFRRVCHSFRALGAERAAKFDTSAPGEAELPRICALSRAASNLPKMRNANFICFFLRLFRRASLLFD